MKINLSVLGKFHTFDLARELYARGILGTIYTGYPTLKLRNEGLPMEKINTFPYLHGSFMAYPYKNSLPVKILKQWEYLSRTTLDRHVARIIDDCDVFVGLSGSGLFTGQIVKRIGASYVCDRGSAHIREQDTLLREEHKIWKMPYTGIDPRIIEREEAEYYEADCITVPSSFAFRSFQERNIPVDKIKLLPYGVNLTRFQKVAAPENNQFNVLFVGSISLQKGIPYLLQAYMNIKHKKKTLTLAGAVNPEVISMLARNGLWSRDIRVLGHVPQPELKNLMSKSHVMVLPSIQEGLAMVQAQAMACGCAVIASKNSGAEDLFENGKEGFIVPIRSADAIAERLQFLADNPNERDAMGDRALTKVRSIGGWQTYGEQAVAIYQGLRS